ncbi:MAG TPA: nuclear transport factor 2 family protein [Mycobacterium sp.]|uniref:nuclear transport factor 2 family protein n=1 Tax=Mycobacterium sp. TaxID=1785 RepID=UPI002D28E493|nr:nuclear transport factor 2 family protein [Mycobacterium sp.]HXY63436.1 nuclear transport factor 2 family protein [Mycobacterium sp.]
MADRKETDSTTATPNALATFCAAAQTNDVDAMVGALSPDVELLSPLIGRMIFRGTTDLRILLGAAFGCLRGLRWQEVVSDGQTCVAVSEARVAGLRISDAMVIELDDAGRITRIRPHLRPWLAITAFALWLGPKLARHPGVIRRALENHRDRASADAATDAKVARSH